MTGLSHAPVGLASCLIVLALLGLRHATDPDHLAAVSQLLVLDPQGLHRAHLLSLAWGCGHGLVVMLASLPVVLGLVSWPQWMGPLADRMIGLILILIAVRLLWVWRKSSAHDHIQPAAPRSLSASFGIGAMHGLAGTGAISVLMLAAIPNRSAALLGLLVFSLATMLGMVLIARGLGPLLIGRSQAQRRWSVPVLACCSAAAGLMLAVSGG